MRLRQVVADESVHPEDAELFHVYSPSGTGAVPKRAAKAAVSCDVPSRSQSMMRSIPPSAHCATRYSPSARSVGGATIPFVSEHASAQHAQARAVEHREGARIGRGHGAHQIVDLARTLAPVDAPVVGLAAAEVAALGEILGGERRGAVDEARHGAIEHQFAPRR